ncbi:outer dynein arm-docking complex subunit 2-like [Eucyclogobius newberryi]|uniref:outer dynein arm-docking complex subunit 2-like n=1 Tax=Eucyclogobius newberryi TaxID=166745 RepID=UPI003B5ADD89
MARPCRPSLLGSSSPKKSRTPACPRLEEVLSESSSDSEREEEEQLERPSETNEDLTLEELNVQLGLPQIIKSLQEGDELVTALTLCVLMELDLKQEKYQLAIRDLGGLVVLLNLLDTREIPCIIGSIKILHVISQNFHIQKFMVKKSGIQSLVPLLELTVPEAPELQSQVAEILANVAKIRKARRTLRHCGGIDKLVRLLDCAPASYSLSPEEDVDVEAARCGALALWNCSQSARNREAICKAGGISLLGRLLCSPHDSILLPVIGTLQECASEKSCRNAIQNEGMIKDLVKNLSIENEELQMLSANAIFKCAEDEKAADVIHKYKGPERLAQLLNKPENKQLFAAVTGAIWKCSLIQKNISKFQELRVLEKLVSLMSQLQDDAQVYVVAALAEFLKIPANIALMGKTGGTERLVRLLTSKDQALLVNVTRTLGICATDKKNMVIIEQRDGMRLVWSLLKNPSPEVQSSAAWALCPIIRNGKDQDGQSMRSLIGGFHLLIKLLESTNNEVLASICGVIATLAENKDKNVALLTEYGVVPLLANLTRTTDARLQRSLAEAIGYCCMWNKNCAAFRKAGAVAPLAQYVKSPDTEVHKTAVVALYHLSKDEHNCIILHSKGVVKPLLELSGHNDKDVAFMAAECVKNIRIILNKLKK